MIGIIWSFLTGNKIVRTIGMVVMAVLGVLTFGAVKKREGAQGAKAKQAAEAARAKEKTIEDVLREVPSDDPVDDIRERMRKRAKQP